MAQLDPKKVDEIIKCGKDPRYFIKSYVKIQHPLKGLIPFKTYPYQDDCIEEFNKHRFNIVLKSRQLGLSTVTAAYAVWQAIFYQQKNILVIATKLLTANNFIKKVKTIIDSLPPWLLVPKLIGESKTTISFNNGSQIKAIPTSPDAGRSEALSLLIVDEAAFIRDFGEIWTGLYPTLSTGGAAIIISTPNGMTGTGQQYYRMWVEADSGQNNFNTIRLPWDVHPEHDATWFENEKRNLGTPQRIAQELLCDFQASGDTFIQLGDLARLRDGLFDPSIKDGHVWVWQLPRPGKKYVISADVARGNAADYSTFEVFEYETGEQCAEYMGKTPPDKFGELLVEWGKKYNDALLIPENNTYGYMTCLQIRALNYPKLYFAASKGDPFNYTPSDGDTPGFSTNTKTRAQILSRLEEAIRNNHCRIYSRRLYEQLHAFVWTNGKAAASADSHDDLVIAAAIGVWLISGGDRVTSDTAIIQAMLNSTSVVSRPRPPSLDNVNVVAPPGVFGTSRNPYAQIDPRTRNAFNALDFSWVTRR